MKFEPDHPLIEVALSSSISLSTPLGNCYLTMLNSQGRAAKTGEAHRHEAVEVLRRKVEKEESCREGSYWLSTNRGEFERSRGIIGLLRCVIIRQDYTIKSHFSTACQRTRSQRINNPPGAFDIWAESAKLNVSPSFRHSTWRKGVYVVRMEDSRPHCLGHSVYISPGPGLQRVQVRIR